MLIHALQAASSGFQVHRPLLFANRRCQDWAESSSAQRCSAAEERWLCGRAPSWGQVCWGDLARKTYKHEQSILFAFNLFQMFYLLLVKWIQSSCRPLWSSFKAPDTRWPRLRWARDGMELDGHLAAATLVGSWKGWSPGLGDVCCKTKPKRSCIGKGSKATKELDGRLAWKKLIVFCSQQDIKLIG